MLINSFRPNESLEECLRELGLLGEAVSTESDQALAEGIEEGTSGHNIKDEEPVKKVKKSRWALDPKGNKKAEEDEELEGEYYEEGDDEEYAEYDESYEEVEDEVYEEDADQEDAPLFEGFDIFEYEEVVEAYLEESYKFS